MTRKKTGPVRAVDTPETAVLVDLDGLDREMFPLRKASDVAAMLSCSTSLVHRLATAGVLPYCLIDTSFSAVPQAERKEGVRRRFRADHIRELIRRWSVGDLPGYTVSSRQPYWADPDPRLPLRTAKEVGELLGISAYRVHNMAWGGHLPYVVVPGGAGAVDGSEGHRRRFRQDHVSELVERWTVPD